MTLLQSDVCPGKKIPIGSTEDMEVSRLTKPLSSFSVSQEEEKSVELNWVPSLWLVMQFHANLKQPKIIKYANKPSDSSFLPVADLIYMFWYLGANFMQ